MALNINGTTGISGVDGSASAPALQGSDSNTGVSFGTDTVNINTGGSTRATVDSSGNLGVGTSSPDQILHLNKSSGDTYLRIQGGTNQGTLIHATDGTLIGGFVSGGAVAGGTSDIAMRVESGNNMLFAHGTTEGMRMSSNQNIFIHCTNNSGSNGRIYTNGTNGGTITTFEINQNAGSGSEMITFRNNGSQLGTIHQSGSGVNYQSNSDYRLKENDVAISDGITRIKQLRPIRFNWKEDANTTVDGFFAHEVSPVVPESVRGNKDEVFDTDGVGTQVVGGPKYQQLDQSKLVPLLTAALQEAIVKIEVLETKVAALEAA